MHNKAYALMTGVFLLVLMAGTLAAAWWLAGVERERLPYIIVTDGSVSGLSDGAQIFYRGVRAGRVEHIRLDPDAPQYILIDIAVSADVPESLDVRACAARATMPALFIHHPKDRLGPFGHATGIFLRYAGAKDFFVSGLEAHRHFHIILETDQEAQARVLAFLRARLELGGPPRSARPSSSSRRSRARALRRRRAAPSAGLPASA
jgi:fermentation-respiration switch protein FrsA (DUF1100 family)